MKMLLIVIAVTMLLSFKVFAKETKSSVLQGYNNQCVNVLTGKGFKSDTVNQECQCEVDVIDKNYKTLQLINAGEKSESGHKGISRQEVTRFKRKIMLCKAEFLYPKRFKRSVLDGYKKQCGKILSGRGYKSDIVNRECKCEVDIFNKNFDIYKLVILGRKAVNGNKLLSDGDLKKMMHKVARCKAKYLQR